MPKDTDQDAFVCSKHDTEYRTECSICELNLQAPFTWQTDGLRTPYGNHVSCEEFHPVNCIRNSEIACTTCGNKKGLLIACEHSQECTARVHWICLLRGQLPYAMTSDKKIIFDCALTPI